MVNAARKGRALENQAAAGLESRTQNDRGETMAKGNAKRLSGADIAMAAATMATEDLAQAMGIKSQGLEWEQALLAVRHLCIDHALLAARQRPLRWQRADSDGQHARVCLRGDEPVIELTAAPGAGTSVDTQQWGVLARWRPTGADAWSARSWECRNESDAMSLLDAVAFGIVAVCGGAGDMP